MSNPETKYYVYIYYNPLKNNIELYVGESGDPRRWLKHLKDAKRFIRQNRSQKWIQKNADNPVKTRTIMKILKAGLEPIIEKVMEGVDEQTAKTEEIRLIAHHGRADKGLGSLTNMTDGGDGGATIPRDNLLGQRFGRLMVLESAPDNKFGKPRWLCKCDCGNEKIIEGRNLTGELTKSCGCLQIESKTTHGMWNTPEYNTWHSLRIQTTNPKLKKFEYYDKNNIKMCDRWLKSFENFYEDMGERPTDKHVLSRINNDGGFELSNCKWATKKEHSNNRRNTKYLTVDGKTKTLSEWSEISGTKPSILHGRLRRSWSHKEAIFGK